MPLSLYALAYIAKNGVARSQAPLALLNQREFKGTGQVPG